jgi:hypothetical protein
MFPFSQSIDDLKIWDEHGLTTFIAPNQWPIYGSGSKKIRRPKQWQAAAQESDFTLW